MRFNTLDDWLSWQEKLHPSEIELGLERVEQVLKRFYPQQNPFTVITVGGTNGKGSTVSFLEAILHAAGYRVGCYTSPHFIHYNERIRINGSAVTDRQLCEAFDKVDKARFDSGTSDTRGQETQLTYFEFGTLAALELFVQQQCEVVVLEVGLGGRLDAVNAVEPDVSVVTTVDLDHQAWLGDNLDDIGREKAGIYRAGKVGIYGDTDPPQGLLQAAETLGSQLVCFGQDFNAKAKKDTWDFIPANGQVRHDLPLPSLRGSHQIKNATNALMALTLLHEKLPVTQADIRLGLLQAQLPGRFEVIPGEPPVILDVAHNPQAARTLRDNLEHFAIPGDTHAIIGMLDDKDTESVIGLLKEQFASWQAIPLDSPRAIAPSQLARIISKQVADDKVTVATSFTNAYDKLKQTCQTHDRVVVFGSFFTVSLALSALVGE